MEIRSDFSQPALVHTDDLEWLASPVAGVDRRMLDRIGDEVARATSIVRYAKGSAFSEHTHAGGEEFIVLEGVFQDEHGDYPAGTYVRNPVGTHHIPRSDPGCTIFVKLWQFDPEDQEQYAVDLNSVALGDHAEREGVRSAALAKRDYEHVALEEWSPNGTFELLEQGGFEMLLFAGGIVHKGQIYRANDWIRWPAGSLARFATKAEGARIWIKRGHLTAIHTP